MRRQITHPGIYNAQKDYAMTTYSFVSRINHWLFAILFISMLGFGFYLAYGGLELPKNCH